jgi:UPF0755 protein
MSLNSLIRRILFILFGLIISIFILIIGIFFFPAEIITADEKEDVVIKIEKDQSVNEIARILKEQGIIRSVAAFKIYMRITGDDRSIMPGDYLFRSRASLAGTGYRISHGDYKIEQRKIIIPEGTSTAEIALIIQKEYPDFDAQDFIEKSRQYEGYLFPDSYELFQSTSTEIVLKTLRDNFEQKTMEVRKEAEEKGLIFEEVVNMASILEEEGKSKDDREIISGILYNRLNSKIPLQVDATFRYINAKTTKDLTLADLKIQSPYNTYVNTGLPPTPITNPGLESIRAAINPKNSEFLYFLTGNDGSMHYSHTFEEHVQNKNKYLK